MQLWYNYFVFIVIGLVLCFITVCLAIVVKVTFFSLIIVILISNVCCAMHRAVE